MKDKIVTILQEAVLAKTAVLEDDALITGIVATLDLMGKTINAGGVFYMCGNGGSACDAMHFTEELVARYKRHRIGVKAMHFMDGGTLTCWSNDYTFETVFQRQVETFCSDRDALFAFSTSGNSVNICAALEAARIKNCPSVLFTGKDGGMASPIADISLIVPQQNTERIQEVHITLVHTLCELLETEVCPALLNA